MEKEGPFSFQMYEAIEKQNIKKIPLLVGFTSEELLLNRKYTQKKHNKIQYYILLKIKISV